VVEVEREEEPVGDGRNRRPRLRDLALQPAKPRTGTDVKLNFKAVDPDGDRTKITIEWFVNDAKVSGANKRILNNEYFEKGDEVHAVVEVDDRKLQTTKETDPVVIVNTPPEIVMPRGKPAGIDGMKIKATDADGDSLRFRVEEAPPGLTIDAKGVVHYKGDMETTEGGVYPTRIIVEDGGPEYAAWEMKLTLNASKASERTLRGAGSGEKEDG
jgi:hypothetical protein